MVLSACSENELQVTKEGNHEGVQGASDSLLKSSGCAQSLGHLTAGRKESSPAVMHQALTS